MSISKTFRYEDVWGKTPIKIYDVTLDSSYPTNGYTPALGFKPEAFGLKSFLGVKTLSISAAGSGIVAVEYDFLNAKLMAFRVATFTPVGTISGNVTVVGGGIGEAIGINPDTNAGVLSKAAATNRTIPIATLLGAAPTFTGTAQGQVALAEVSNAVNLSAVIVRLLMLGGNVES
jgi:hypothetical protein